MRTTKVINVVTAVVLMIVLAGFLPKSVSAQSQSGSGMRISPIKTELTIKPGESKLVNIYVTNVTESPITLSAIINDFGAGKDETGTARLYMDEKESAPANGLKKYIQPIEDITLQPKEQKNVKATIAIPGNAAGGGYYAAVRFEPSNKQLGNSVNLTGSAGSLILVTVLGDIREQASVASFNVARNNGDTIGKASNFFTNGKATNKKGLVTMLRIRNSGNVQIAPFGKIILSKSGKQIGSYEVNDTQPRSNVLPDSVRRFEISLDDKTSSFGKYTVEGNFGYGSKGQLISAKTTFWVVPLTYLLIGAGFLLVLIAGLLILPRMLKSHDRKLIRKIRGTRGK